MSDASQGPSPMLSEGTRRNLRLLAAGVGVGSLVAAVSLVTGLGGSLVSEAASNVPGRRLVFVLAFAALVVCVVVLRQAWVQSDDTDVGLPDPDDEAESGTDLVGSEVDYVLEQLEAVDETVTRYQRQDAEAAIRSVAVDVLRSENGYDLEECKAALEAGSWTDDPRAATYLGADVQRPVRIRVIDWVAGDPYRRQVDATVAELAAIADVETEVESP